MRKLGFILYFFILSQSSIASSPPPNNAVALSLGGASTTYLNALSIENNVGALAYSKNEISLNGSNSFGLTEYSRVMLAGNIKTKYASIGFAYQVNPVASLTVQKAQFAIAKQLGEKLSAGVALNYHQFSSTDAYYKSSNSITFNAGLYYRVNDKLNTGFSVFNPNQSKLTNNPAENLNSSLRLGLDYALVDNIKLYCDAIQNSGQKLDLNAGLELKKDDYKIRGGFGLNHLLALGFGWDKNKFGIDVAAAYHNQLGFSPSLNIRYAF
ncbi:type IX secretion system membrane protein PorP/SprF [Bacteroidia bacterium]|nr:type IX secretion system membrane protein PorP/SprF [Bacteroidia bacterium]